MSRTSELLGIDRPPLALHGLVLAVACSSGSDGREPGLSSGATATDGGHPTSTTDTGLDDTRGGEGPSETRRMELAGHSLAGHPYFRRVQAFDDDDSIEIAIDPAEVPDLDGRTCDVHVVAAKSAGDWEQDDGLSDVRASGPTELAVQGTLADSRVELSAPGELSSDAAAGLGVAYDVVLDCDRDGRLGAGDVIDGGDPAGLHRIHDVTLPGPLEVSVFEAYGGEFLDQRTFHPTEIAAMGKQPLVVVTHGWSYDHTYYDYIGEHLASYGYIVMVHEADVQDGGPEGTLSAAATTLDNTEDLLENQGFLGNGVLDGHIDEHRIMLVGHSTGGEAVVRAVTELRDGTYSSSHFGHDDIRIVSSMAPVSWHPRTVIDPGDVNYHMFVAGADADVSGAPELSYTQCRSIFERARGARQLTYIHGAGHGDLLGCCGELFIDESAPGLIGRAETNRVARGYLFALAELYLQGNPAAEELFTRPFAAFHPPGIAEGVVVTNEYRGPRAGAVVLDDFETEPALDRSSSGGTVTFDVGNATEILMQDNDGSLAWTGSQPSNGMTHARHAGDDPHAIVFDWSPGADAFYEQEVVPGLRDFTAYEFLSLRATQGTRHPETVALDGPLSFTITLRDEAGTRSAIRLDDRTSVPPPYARAGFGPGTGWQNEFTTIRLRIRDFLAGSELDLARIEAVRLDFGASFGSSRGRIGLDDLELVR